MKFWFFNPSEVFLSFFGSEISYGIRLTKEAIVNRARRNLWGRQRREEEDY